METLVLKSETKSELKLIADLAKKPGIKARYFTEEEKEDIGMVNAIKQGDVGRYVDTDGFIKKLRK